MIDINDLGLKRILEKINPKKVKDPKDKVKENEKVLGILDEKGIKLYGAWKEIKQRKSKKSKKIYDRIHHRERQSFTEKEVTQLTINQQIPNIIEQIFWVHVQKKFHHTSKKLAIRKNFKVVVLPPYDQK
ncbi:MAG TPA: hypothetical protein VKO61_00500 [Candidatus Paceibacterota bacterium]|nr:hypothetical protein [Candidatus Paceibacterota bacterium]